MLTTTALLERLKKLEDEVKETNGLINELRNSTTSAGRDNLGIHARLKAAEQELEILRVNLDATDASTSTRARASAFGTEKGADNERLAAMAGKLANDLKNARIKARDAQLHAKRAADSAKRNTDLEKWRDGIAKRRVEPAEQKEKEPLLLKTQPSNRQNRNKPSEKFTQDDMVLNASNDVTAALRRTHNLMQAELSRSQFAQETLEQSTAAISSLTESYSSLDTLLSSSRSLANSLLRSQKSDTWYLETTFYILLGTIAWLLFRRVLYGPIWWLVWLPLKLILRFAFAALGAVGLSSTTSVQSSSIDSKLSEAFQHTVTTLSGNSVPTNSVSWDNEPSAQEEEDRLIDQIGRMVNGQGETEGTSIDDISPEEKRRQEEMPRNPKKRMYEAEEPLREEL